MTGPRLPAEAIVLALYRALLGREPDPHGERDAIAALRGAPDARGVEDLLNRILDSSEFRARRLDGHSLGIADHSQFGEFALWVERVVNLASRWRFLVDVGARGREGSNSFDLLNRFGWSGLLIEANADLIPLIAEEFAGLKVTIVNAIVSDQERDVEFHVADNPDVSSLRRDMTESMSTVRESRKVRTRRLPEILATHDVPFDFDLLSLDLEGEDVAVLNDLIGTSRYRPSWIILEASFGFATRALSDVGLDRSVLDLYHLEGQTFPNLLLRRSR